MKLKVCKDISDKFKNAKTISVSNKYVVVCTGKSAMIYDKNLNLLKNYNNLSYVYTAKISPNEQFVALISNSNVFYIVDFEDYTIYKHSLHREYNNNLEGRGCWKNDYEFYVIVESKITHKSFIRKYDLIDGMAYVDLLEQNYRLIGISFDPKLNLFVIVGQDLQKSMCDRNDDYRLILFNGQMFADYTIEKKDDVVISFEYDTSTKSIVLYGLSKVWCCNIKGEQINMISTPNSASSLFDSNDLMCNVFNEEQIKIFAGLLNLKFANIEDYITKMVASWDGKYCFIGTKTGLFLVNVKNNTIEEQISIQYGVTDILQFSENIILVATWDKLRAYKLE